MAKDKMVDFAQQNTERAMQATNWRSTIIFVRKDRVLMRMIAG